MLHTISKTLLENVKTWLDKGFYQKNGIQRLSFKENECELTVFKYHKERRWEKNVKVYSYLSIDKGYSDSEKISDNWIESIPKTLLSEIDSNIPIVIMLPDSSVRVSQLENSINVKKDRMYIEWLAKKNISPDGKFSIRVNQHKEHFITTAYSEQAINVLSELLDSVNVDRILPECSIFETVEEISQKVIVFFYQNSLSIVFYNENSEVYYFRVIDVVEFNEDVIDRVYRFCCTVLEFSRVPLNKNNILYKVQACGFNYDLLGMMPWVLLDNVLERKITKEHSLNDIFFLRTLGAQVDVV